MLGHLPRVIFFFLKKISNILKFKYSLTPPIRVRKNILSQLARDKIRAREKKRYRRRSEREREMEMQAVRERERERERDGDAMGDAMMGMLFAVC
jgi:hypothetical protein